jgi:hypothetical protein
VVIYDETYGVIYEVIMRKFRASMEPFKSYIFVGIPKNL